MTASTEIKVTARTDDEALGMVIALAKRGVISSESVLRTLMQRCVMVKVGSSGWTYLDGEGVRLQPNDDSTCLSCWSCHQMDGPSDCVRCMAEHPGHATEVPA